MTFNFSPRITIHISARGIAALIYILHLMGSP
jgi:hypothetical protein